MAISYSLFVLQQFSVFCKFKFQEELFREHSARSFTSVNLHFCVFCFTYLVEDLQKYYATLAIILPKLAALMSVKFVTNLCVSLLFVILILILIFMFFL